MNRVSLQRIGLVALLATIAVFLGPRSAFAHTGVGPAHGFSTAWTSSHRPRPCTGNVRRRPLGCTARRPSDLVRPAHIRLRHDTRRRTRNVRRLDPLHRTRNRALRDRPGRLCRDYFFFFFFFFTSFSVCYHSRSTRHHSSPPTTADSQQA